MQSTDAYYDREAAKFDHIPFGPTLLPNLLLSILPPSETSRGQEDHKPHDLDPASRQCQLNALDVGSGPGALAAWLRDSLRYNVECVDPSASMVNLCWAKGLTAYQCTIQQYTPEPLERVFDVILAVSCLFHIPKIELASHAIPKIDALLRPGGHLVVSLMIGEDTEGYLDPTSSGITRYFSGLLPGEFMSLLPGSQYRIRHEESLEVPAMGHNFWVAVLSKSPDAI